MIHVARARRICPAKVLPLIRHSMASVRLSCTITRRGDPAEPCNGLSRPLTDGMISLAPPPAHARHKSNSADTRELHPQWPSARLAGRTPGCEITASHLGNRSRIRIGGGRSIYLRCPRLSMERSVPHALSSVIQRGPLSVIYRSAWIWCSERSAREFASG